MSAHRARAVRARVAPAVLCALLAGPGWAQPQPAFPPGSPIGLVPPGGGVPGPTFPGFKRPHDGASFLLAELPPDACAEMRGGVFTADRLAAQGIRADTTRPVRIGGRDGTLPAGAQRQGGRVLAKWAVPVCAPEATAMMSAQVPGYPAPSAVAAATEAALATVAVRRAGVEERRAALPFAFAELPARLVLRDVVLGSMAALTPPGTPHAPATLKLLSARSGGPAIPAEHAEALAERRLRAESRLAGASVQTRARERIAGGLDTVRLDARITGPSDRTALRLARWLALAPTGGYLRMIAAAPGAQHRAFVADFDTVARG